MITLKTLDGQTWIFHQTNCALNIYRKSFMIYVEGDQYKISEEDFNKVLDLIEDSIFTQNIQITEIHQP